MKKIKLNLGCGRNLKKGWINIDFVPSDGVDMVFDLNKYPWPFKENSVDEISMENVLEHLEDPNSTIREIWRVSKKGSTAKITVPHFSSACAWGDLTHKRPFSIFSMEHYDLNSRMNTSLNTGTKTLFNVSVTPFVPLLFRLFGIKKFIDLFPRAYEKYLTFIFPFRRIRV
jgi:ubiquinone/menaquinone biosynthesis C-methylase UbiE